MDLCVGDNDLPMGSRKLGRDERRRRQARQVGGLGFLLAAALPWLLFHRVIGEVAASFHLSLNYLTGWAPWALIVIGLLFMVPVMLSIGRDPDSRLYPRARNAYAGWGITLYLLGFALATQVAQLTATSTH